MIKYVPELTDVVLEEIPDKVTLAVEISNCRGSCIGCHSPFLKQDIGVELTPDAVDRLIADNFGVNCFLLLGEGNDHGCGSRNTCGCTIRTWSGLCTRAVPRWSPRSMPRSIM